MPSGWRRRIEAGSAHTRLPRRHNTQSPGSSSTGSSTFTEASQAIHSHSNRHSRDRKVVTADSRAPESRPRSPPSILAAAVAGSGVPVVLTLNATQGRRITAGRPHTMAERLGVSGPASQRSGTSRTDSGRASTARPRNAAETGARPAT
jgi:hypothetical protein